MTLFEDLKWRGLIKDISSPELEKKLNEEKLTFYIGTDPTADSMHIGHFSSFLIATRLARYGHHPILLVGGATGLIGDPKPSQERQMISKEEVFKNVEGLTRQAEKIFGFEVVNNYDWTKDITILDFLRDYGKYIQELPSVNLRIPYYKEWTLFIFMRIKELLFKLRDLINGET